MNEHNNQNRVEFSDSQSTIDYQRQASRRDQSSKDRISRIVNWVADHSGGLVKKDQVLYLILGITLLAIIVSLIVIFSGDTQPEVEPGINPATGERIPGEI